MSIDALGMYWIDTGLPALTRPVSNRPRPLKGQVLNNVNPQGRVLSTALNL
jgi:hypothetical protein